MDNNNPIKYSDLISPDNSIDTLIKQLTDTQEAYDKLADSIKTNAKDISAALKNVSGATDEGRRKTTQAATDAERLAKAQEEVQRAQSETAKELAGYNALRTQANQINKLEAKLARSVAGSYDALSAQYSLNKIRLNAMSVEEREATDAGRELVERTHDIYEEMKRLQEATGKHTLSVGDYGKSTIALNKQLRAVREELTRLRLEGKANSEEYIQLAQKAGQLQDIMGDVRAEIKNLASDTSELDAIMGGASGIAGAFTAATGAMALFGDESEEVQAVQKKLQAVIAITTGLTTLQNQVQKQSALMKGIETLQTKALTKAKEIDYLATEAGTKATYRAIVAQKLLNAVGKSNPYVLLAIALVSVVGALVAYTAGADKAAEKQQRLNEAQKNALDLNMAWAAELKRLNNERQAQLSRELATAKAEGKSYKETQKIEVAMLNERIAANEKDKAYWADTLNNLDANRDKLEKLRQGLLTLNKAKASGRKTMLFDVNLDGRYDRVKIDEAIQAIQGHIDNYERKVEIAVGIKTEADEIAALRAQLIAQHMQQLREMQHTETEIVRSAEDLRMSFIDDRFEREAAMAEAETRRQIEDIRERLKTEANLTTTARAALNQQIEDLESALAGRLFDIEREMNSAILALERETQAMELQQMEEGAAKQRALLEHQFKVRLEDLRRRLYSEGGLSIGEREQIEKQILLIIAEYGRKREELERSLADDQRNREIDAIQLRLAAVAAGGQEELDLRLRLIELRRQAEIAANAKLAQDMQQAEADINAKYAAQVLSTTEDFIRTRETKQFASAQALAESEFNLLRTSEVQKKRFALQQQAEKLQAQLDLDKKLGGKMTEQERQTIRNTIDATNQEMQRLDAKSWGESIQEAVGYALDALSEYADKRLEMAEQAVAAADKEVEAAKKALDAEREARAQGYASNVAAAQKELALARATQKQALADQARAQQQQEAINTLTQISSLVTASAQIWGQLGFPWAIPALAVMWASFAASKIMAFRMAGTATEKYGDGTVELLSGGSHQSGHDIDLGTKPDGTRRRAEGGEFFAVINKRNSRRFRREIPQVINALNDGSFADKYLRAFDGAEALTVAAVDDRAPDLSGLSSDVRKIREQGERHTYTDAEGRRVEVYKNLTRRIKVS